MDGALPAGSSGGLGFADVLAALRGDLEHLANFDPHERDTPVRVAYERISRVLGCPLTAKQMAEIDERPSRGEGGPIFAFREAGAEYRSGDVSANA